MPGTAQLTALAEFRYFMSPEYQTREDWSEAYHDGDHWNNHKIKEDPRNTFGRDLDLWLRRNTIDSKTIISQDGTNFRVYSRYSEEKGSAKKEGTWHIKPYRIVVSVASAPPGRELPEGLVELFNSHGFTQTTGERFLST